jgi:hypothetical protein
MGFRSQGTRNKETIHEAYGQDVVPDGRVVYDVYGVSRTRNPGYGPRRSASTGVQSTEGLLTKQSDQKICGWQGAHAIASLFFFG